MSFETSVLSSVQRMFSHSKTVVGKNLHTAIKEGKLTIDPSKIPGLQLLISQSIDEAFRSSAKDLNGILSENSKRTKKE